ncbi:MAG: hypothetical protein WDN72_09390 [Alphaproteobacteria bacterium]
MPKRSLRLIAEETGLDPDQLVTRVQESRSKLVGALAVSELFPFKKNIHFTVSLEKAIPDAYFAARHFVKEAILEETLDSENRPDFLISPLGLLFLDVESLKREKKPEEKAAQVPVEEAPQWQTKLTGKLREPIAWGPDAVTRTVDEGSATPEAMWAEEFTTPEELEATHARLQKETDRIAQRLKDGTLGRTKPQVR